MSTIPDNRKVFTYNESNGISSLDPAFARNLENMWAVNQLFDGLVELDANLKVEPLIASSWDIQDSGLTYVFHLRDDVFFHPSIAFGEDSTRQVVASDFQYSFNRIVNPATASSGKWVFDLVDFENSNGFESPNDSTFVIHLKQAFSPFLGMLAMQYCNVVPAEAIDYYGEDFRENPIGTGPFKMAFWMENVALVYHKNTKFFQSDTSGVPLPYLDAVKIEFVRDMSAEFMGLIKGEYDFMSGIHPAYKDELLEPSGELNSAFAKDIRFQKTPFIKTDYIGLLVDEDIPLAANHPLHDARVRRALNHSVNRDQMVRFLRNNAVVSAEHGFVPKGLPSYNEDSNYGTPYDIAKAKELLAEADSADALWDLEA
ncbi:MAG: ABC transporter substrate-binding protein, partial [Flavobacteriales bacterium]